MSKNSKFGTDKRDNKDGIRHERGGMRQESFWDRKCLVFGTE